jgi:hypothetical protein
MPPLVQRKVNRKKRTSRDGLFVKDKNALLAVKTNFFYLAIFTEKNGVVIRFRAALFPTAFGLGDLIFAALDADLVSVNGEPVFAGLQRDLANFCRLGDIDRLHHGLCEGRHGKAECDQKSRDAKEGIGFHECHSFHQGIESANGPGVLCKRS